MTFLLGLMILLLLQPTAAHAELRLKRPMFLYPSALGNPGHDYLPIADMDRDGLLEMAYRTGFVSDTNPARWEYGRFLPFNRWLLLYADTILWPPPDGLDPASFRPFAMGDADHDGLNEMLGVCVSWFGGGSDDSVFFCTMEQRTPTDVPDTITWLRFVTVNAMVQPVPQLPGDLDGDGHDDILAWSTTTDSLRGHYMLENRGDNAYVRTWTPSGSIGGPAFAYGDCDRDGRIEFMGRGQWSGEVCFWESTGDDQYACVFRDTTAPGSNFGYDCFYGRDVDRNGRPEFFQTRTADAGRARLFMWESDADNHYVRTLVDSVGHLDMFGRSMCGDLDGDGVDEVVWNLTRYLRIYQASPGETLRCVGTWQNDHDSSRQFGATVNIADVNYDGYGEIIFACRYRVSVLEVEAVQVLEPSEHAEYSPGDTCRISWQTFSPPRCDSVSLFLRTDSTYELDTIARGLAPDDTPYVWIVPDIAADSAYVMAIAYGPGWQYDESDNAIRILGAGTGVGSERPVHIREFSLSVNPNPARGALSVHYDVPREGRVSVAVYDASGRLVRLLADGDVAPGRYEAALGRGTLPAGVYFCTLASGEKRISRKVVLAE